MSSIARKPHCLKREKNLAMPRHIIFFDTETIQKRLDNGNIEQRLKLGWVCYYRKAYGRHLERLDWQYFEDALTFWQFVFRHTENKRKLWVIARNVCFDFTIVKGWHYLRQVGFKLKFFHNDGVTSVISVKGQYGSIVFLDVMNWFVESLAETGKRIGLEKLEIDFANCSKEKLSTYCHRDLEIELLNFRGFMRFLESNYISRLCYTRGSTAMAAYLFGYYRQKIYIHNNAEAIALERDAYKGGRTECFFLGALNSEKYHVLDVSSLYPYVMSCNAFPVKYRQSLNAPDGETLLSLLKDGSVIANVLIETDEPAYAVRRDRTIFPVGRFWTTLTTPELKYALDKGHLIEVKRAVVYDQGDIFSRYVKHFYALRLQFRKEGNAEYAELCKKLLNSLYGKFGQKADVWEKIGDCPGERDRIEVCFKPGSNARSEIRYLLGEIFELVGQEECYNSFPAICAEVTAYARLYLYELMKAAGVGNYFYCDTDSLIVNDVGLARLKKRIHKTKLGYLKLVETTNSVVIRGLKDYSVGDKQVIKGIRKTAVKLADGEYEQEIWPSFKGMLRSGTVDTYTVKRQHKILKRKYTKGHVNSDGTISPLVLSDSWLTAQPLF